MPIIQRRAFLAGLGALFIGGPAIVRPSSIMPVKKYIDDVKISMRMLTEYVPGAGMIDRLDIRYGLINMWPWPGKNVGPELFIDLGSEPFFANPA